MMGEPTYPTFYASSRNAQPWSNHTIFNPLQNTKLIHRHQTAASLPLAGAIFLQAIFLPKALHVFQVSTTYADHLSRQGKTEIVILLHCSAPLLLLRNISLNQAKQCPHLQHHMAAHKLDLEKQDCNIGGFLKTNSSKVPAMWSPSHGALFVLTSISVRNSI